VVIDGRDYVDGYPLIFGLRFAKETKELIVVALYNLRFASLTFGDLF